MTGGVTFKDSELWCFLIAVILFFYNEAWSFYLFRL